MILHSILFVKQKAFKQTKNIQNSEHVLFNVFSELPNLSHVNICFILSCINYAEHNIPSPFWLDKSGQLSPVLFLTKY